MAIIVDVKVKDGPATSSLRKLETVIDGINKAVAQLNVSLGHTASTAAAAAANLQNLASTGRRTASRGGGGGGGRSSRRPPRFDPFANDPLAGVNYFRSGAAAGNPFHVRMYMRYMRLFDQLQRGQAMAQHGPKGSVDPVSFALHQALMRTRFGRGAAGLAGQVLGVDLARLSSLGQHGAIGRLLGPGAGAAANIAGSGAVALGPIVAALAPAVGYVAALGVAAIKARDALDRWTSSLVTGGGSPGQARAASRIEEALGLGAGGGARIARGLMDGFGMAAASMAGVNPIGGPFGDINYNQKFLRLIDYVASLPRTPEGFDRARRFSEMAGAPELAKFALLSPAMQQILRSQAARQATFGNLSAGAEFEASLAVVKDSFRDIVVSVGTPGLRIAARVFARVADAAGRVNWDAIGNFVSSTLVGVELAAAALGGLADLLERIAAAGPAARESIKSFLPPHLRVAIDAAEIAGNVRRAIGGGRQREEALKENTKATRDLTTEIRRTQGTFGGGPRAEGSTPSKLQPALSPGYQNVRVGVL